MGLTLQEVGAKVSFEYSDGKVVITDDSVEFYGLLAPDAADGEYALEPSFSLDFDNFGNVVAAFEKYTQVDE